MTSDEPNQNSPHPPLVSIVIPAYNEEAALGDDLDLIWRTMTATGRPFEVIVVDDGSTDRTAAIVAARPGVRLLQHPYNRGTGAATNTGIRAARGEIVVMTDGDGSYPNQDIPRLLAEIEQHGYDMVIGARISEKGTLKPLRIAAKEFIRRLACYLTETHIPDLNSGLRAFKKSIALEFMGILPFGHSWVSTITIAALVNGYTVKFIPIDYYPRKGKSSFHPIKDTYGYLLMVIRSVMYFNPLKVFFPVSLFLISAGGIKAIVDIFRFAGHLAPSTLVLLFTGFQIAAIGLLADLIVRLERLRR